MDIRNQMTRPDINGPLGGSDTDQDWQGTLLDRSMQPRRRPPVSSYEPQPKNRLWIAAVAFGIVALVIIVTMMVKGGSADGNAPLIKADVTPYKTRPDQPGGTSVPFQDKLVFNRLDPNGQPVQAEKLLPPPEEPLANKDMTTKQVTAPPAPGNTAVVTTTTPAPLVVKSAAPEPIVEKPAVVAEAPAPVAAPVATVQKTEPVIAAAPTPAPVAKVAEAPKPTVAPTPVAKPVVAAAAPAPATGGQVRIQLASIPEAGNAQKALADLSGKYRGALGGTSLGIAKADLGAKGVYYRIQSGGLSRESAEKICAGVKAQGGACIIAH